MQEIVPFAVEATAEGAWSRGEKEKKGPMAVETCKSLLQLPQLESSRNQAEKESSSDVEIPAHSRAWLS